MFILYCKLAVQKKTQIFSHAAKSSKQSFAPTAAPLFLLLFQFYYHYIIFILLLINLVVL